MVDTKMFEDTSTGDAALAGDPGGAAAGVPGPRQPGGGGGREGRRSAAGGGRGKSPRTRGSRG